MDEDADRELWTIASTIDAEHGEDGFALIAQWIEEMGSEIDDVERAKWIRVGDLFSILRANRGSRH